MRIYTIDQLREQDVEAVTRRLRSLEMQSGLEGVYWLPVPRSLLTPLQLDHEPQCGPYCLALEVEAEAVHMELLIRGLGSLRCACLGFADVALRNHMIAYLETLLTELGVQY